MKQILFPLFNPLSEFVFDKNYLPDNHIYKSPPHCAMKQIHFLLETGNFPLQTPSATTTGFLIYSNLRLSFCLWWRMPLTPDRLRNFSSLKRWEFITISTAHLTTSFTLGFTSSFYHASSKLNFNERFTRQKSSADGTLETDVGPFIDSPHFLLLRRTVLH